ncbi:hypothetical protein glysoja_044519 [Glycine soja]|uniref:Uncharacterized protein n=1 Tax=Glycine soja TaxID=3848 RepID=A0A0B2NVA8_GLYSO|nr:hypothetical protein glysoja_044519 [Glycine soja]
MFLIFYETKGPAVGANPAIPRMFPNMFPLVTSQLDESNPLPEK